MRKNRLQKCLFGLLVIMVCLFLVPGSAQAGEPTDRILEYNIQVDINDDGTLNMIYDISWLVLESDSLGPLEWVEIGIPNSYCTNIQALSDSIESIELKKSGGTYLNVYLKDKYYKDDVANFTFRFTIDHLYKMEEGDAFASYSFTPGWFDEIDVEHLKIRWNAENVSKWSPECLVEDGYLQWDARLDAGDKYTVAVQYPWDAYTFRNYEEIEDYESSDHSIEITSFRDVIFVVFILLLMIFTSLLPIVLAFVLPILIIAKIFAKGSGFSGSTKKIIRTKIEYYPSCPGCGGNREVGKETCMYCGKSMIKSQEEIKEEDIPKEDKELLSFKTAGEYHYSSNPNTYVRVRVVSVPAPRSSSSGSHRSSCAHSSCACAHSSCACACACAGGGRAGCTTKDFYHTNLKLRYLETIQSHANL